VAKKTTQSSASSGSRSGRTRSSSSSARTTKASTASRSSKKTSKSTTKKSTKKTAKKTAKKSTKSAAAKTSKGAKKTTTKKTTKKAKTTKKTSKAAAPDAAKSGAAKSGSSNSSSPTRSKRSKTHFSAKELQHYRELLLEKRADIIGDINGLTNSALRGQDRSNLSNMPLHMADVGSDNYDQELALGLMESEREMLNEVDDALERIHNKTYGICVLTGKPISKARLEVKPWAKYCIEAAREHERTNGR